MQHYFITRGHDLRARVVEFTAESDEAAITVAGQYIDGVDISLWEGVAARHVASFSPRSTPPKSG